MTEQSAGLRTGQSSVAVDFDVMVPMRDGVSLATDVYRPLDDGRHPVLVYRTPYGKSGTGLVIDRIGAVKRGYAVLAQDTRGRNRSGGEWLPWLAHEADDGYDTVEWAAVQPWSDGNVGVYGASAMGVTAIQAAVAAPPHLRAAMVYVAGTNLHNGWIFSNGVFELGFGMHWSLFSLPNQAIARLDVLPEQRSELTARLVAAQAGRWDTMRHLPLADVPALREGVAPQWREWLAHPTYDDYWKAIDAVRRADAIRVPILHGTGWYDNFLRGHLDLQRALQDSPNATLRQQHRFFVGPWEHLSYLSDATSTAGERDFGSTAAGGARLLPDLVFGWFDYWLKGLEGAAAQPRPVRYFVMGLNEWREADSWPPPHAERTYYLQSGGRGNSRLGDGVLSPEPPGDQPPDAFVYDPDNPVPSVGGRTLHREWGPAGVFDQATVEAREDILVYTSPYLTEAVSIAGPVSVVLYASTTGADTDFTAKLVDVEPNGYCANIAEGIVRARFRNGSDHEDWISPGAIEVYTIDLWDVAHEFASGHRVRLEISSSDFPRFDRNLNSRVSPSLGSADDAQIAVQQIWHDRLRPSCLRLPVIE